MEIYIENLSSAKLDFGTFNLGKNKMELLSWEKSVVTPEVFGLILFHYNNGAIQFKDSDGKKKEKKKKIEYDTLTKSGEKSKTSKTEDFDELVFDLNTAYNILQQTI